VSATNGTYIGTEGKVRASDEALTAKVYDQAATDVTTSAKVEQNEHKELERKATATEEMVQEQKEAEAEVLHVVKVTTDWMKHKENNSSSIRREIRMVLGVLFLYYTRMEMEPNQLVSKKSCI
jgi:predicted nucleic acid-binding protein